MDRILIFIPMYNCEKQIPRVLHRIAALGEAQRLFSQVLVVDNRSTDGSLHAAGEAAGALAIPVTVVQNCENYSLGGSHKVAFEYALKNGFDAVVVLHGDDQGDLADLVPYLQNGTAQRFDSFLGSRFAKGARLVNYSGFRIFGNHVFNAIFSVCTGRRITDLGAGLNYYRTDYLRSEFYLPFPNDLTFNVYLLLYGVYCRSRFAFFPLSWREEDQVSNAKLAAQTRRMLRLLGQYLFRRRRLFAPCQDARRDYRFTVIAEQHPEGLE